MLERLRIDIAELQSVSGAYDAGAPCLPGQAELGPKGTAIATEIDGCEVIHFARRGYRRIAQAVVDGQLSAHRDVVLEIAGVLRAAEVGAS